MRIPDIHKGLNALEGYPPAAQTSAPLIQFFKGEDILFEGYLSYDDKPVTSDNWIIKGVIKAGTFNKDIIWEGSMNEGIYIEPALPGYYKILVPSSTMEAYSAGTYWLDILIKEQIGSSNNFRDRTILLSRVPFSYDVTASSIKTDPRNMAERTFPLPTNITKL